MTKVVGIVTRELLGPSCIMEDGIPTPALYRSPVEGDGAPAAPVEGGSPIDSDADNPNPTS